MVKRGKKNLRQSKKENFLLAIFNKIKEGKNPSSISKELGISKQKLYYYTNTLKKQGKIGKHKNGEWFVKVKSFSYGARPKTNIHALRIDIPILSGTIPTNWEIKEKLKNWTPQYKELDILGGLTVRNNNNKSISIYAKSRDIEKLEEVNQLVRDILNWASNSFNQSYNVMLDVFNAQVKNIDIATEDQNAEDMRGKGEKFLLDLDRDSEKILPKDKRPAHAWIDGSPFNFSAETNDTLWKRRYLQMPDKSAETHQLVNQAIPLLNYIAKNYASHVGVVEKLNKLLDETKVKKEVKKSVKSKNQRKLTEW